MKNMLSLASLFVILTLQACTGQSTRATENLSKQMSADDDAGEQKSHQSIQITAPETQIIRELYQSGCLIEQLELNRRKQNMRISCAKEYTSSESGI